MANKVVNVGRKSKEKRSQTFTEGSDLSELVVRPKTSMRSFSGSLVQLISREKDTHGTNLSSIGKREPKRGVDDFRVSKARYDWARPHLLPELQQAQNLPKIFERLSVENVTSHKLIHAELSSEARE